MPPWKADPEYGPFVGQHPLTTDEITLIQRWVDEGAAEGDRALLPPPPAVTEGWQLGKPDLIVSPDEPYQLSAGGSDRFRIFVIPLEVPSLRYVRGIEFRPGNPNVVHHANIKIDRTTASRRFDQQDPAPGYEGLVAVSVIDPDGQFLGWTPGQVAPLLPQNLAWRLEPGTDLVVELHLQPSGKPELVKPSVGLFFTDQPPARTPVMLRLGRQNIDIPAGEDDYVITDSFVLPVDVDLLALQPHAHYRARDMIGEVTLPGGAVRRLIHIANWDFRWQHVYRFVTPVEAPRGSTLAMRYRYDNSDANPRNPIIPARRARWGQRSADEMGDLWIQALARTEEDRATLARTIRPKMIAESIVGYEMLIRDDPARVSLHNDVALLYRELGRHDQEIVHFEASLKLGPDSAAARFNLGAALADAGRLDEAAERYRAALQIAPDHAQAHTGLGLVMLARGQFEEATTHYREALGLDPFNTVAHNNLGYILLERGNADEAIGHFRRALAANPDYADAHYNMARALRARADFQGAAEHFRQAGRLSPDVVSPIIGLAWLLAAAPDDALRNAAEAVGLAERARQIAGPADVQVLDVLAAAYAAAGAFDRAIETVMRALRLTESGGVANALRDRLKLYQRGEPYRLTIKP
jgi:tetratricopeptide (TPR) repeat protein